MDKPDEIRRVVEVVISGEQPCIQVDQFGRLVGLPEILIEQIANRVIEKLSAEGRLLPHGLV